jgi:hypothetical protein
MYAYNQQPENLTFRPSLSERCCVVADCNRPVAAEVYSEDYRATMRAMGFRCPQRQPNRRSGSPRIFACTFHAGDLAVNAALSNPRWQALLMPV